MVLDSGALTAWARPRPPADLLDLLEVAAHSGGAVVVPTVTVVESTTGRQREDARINQLLRRVVADSCTLDRSRQAATLRFRCLRTVSAVDAVVAATAADRTEQPWRPAIPTTCRRCWRIQHALCPSWQSDAGYGAGSPIMTPPGRHATPTR